MEMVEHTLVDEYDPTPSTFVDWKSEDEDFMKAIKSTMIIPPYYEPLKVLRENILPAHKTLIEEFIRWCGYYTSIIEQRKYEFQEVNEHWRIYNENELIKKSGRNSQGKDFSSRTVKKDLLETNRYLIQKYKEQPKVSEQLQVLSKWIKQTKTQKVKSPIFLHDYELGSFMLADNRVEVLRVIDNILNPNTKVDHRYPFSINGIQYKNQIFEDTMPNNLAINHIIVERLSKLITGEDCFIRARMIHLTKGKKSITFVASKSVQGLDLSRLIFKQPNLIPLIDMNNFCALALTAFLVNPQDWKASNFIIPIPESSENMESISASNQPNRTIKLLGLNSGVVFGEGVKKSDSFMTDVRNTLFLFPQMDKPVPKYFLEILLSLKIELVILKWVEIINKLNLNFKKLHEQNIFPYFQQLGFPIKLPPDSLKKIYVKLKKIQNLLKNQTQVTLHDLFFAIEPELADYYLRVRTTYDVPDGIREIYRSSLAYLQAISQIHLPPVDSQSPDIICKFIPSDPIDLFAAVSEFLLEISFSEIDANYQQKIMKKLNFIIVNHPLELCARLISKGRISLDLITFLQSKGMEINRNVASLGGYTLLHFAVAQDNEQLVLYLLQRGANINAIDDQKETPLDKAIKKGSDNMIELLLLRGGHSHI